MGCLYRLISPSGKSYIGATSKTAAIRFSQHIRDARNPRTRRLIGRALEKYGPSNFIIETLVISADMDYLKDLEVRAIDVFKTMWPRGGYNGCRGGNGAVAISKTSERKRVENIRKTMATSTYKNKQILIQKTVWDAARRAKRSEDVKKLWCDPEYRAKVIKAHTGKKQSQEVIAKRMRWRHKS